MTKAFEFIAETELVSELSEKVPFEDRRKPPKAWTQPIYGKCGSRITGYQEIDKAYEFMGIGEDDKAYYWRSLDISVPKPVKRNSFTYQAIKQIIERRAKIQITHLYAIR